MKISELRKQLQNPHTENFYSDWTEFFQRVFSIYITVFLGKTPITANQITVINSFVIIPIAVFSVMHQASLLYVATFLVFLHMTLDCVDGELARLKNCGSLTGLFLDRLNTAIIYPVGFSCIGVGLFLVNGTVYSLIIGFVAAVSSLFLRVIYGNIVLCAVDGLTSKKAKVAKEKTSDSGPKKSKLMEGSDGKEGLGGDIRNKIKQKNVLIRFGMHVVDVFLTRSFGLVLIYLAVAISQNFSLALKYENLSLTFSEIVLCFYTFFALVASFALIIRVVRTQYTEKLLDNLSDK